MHAITLRQATDEDSEFVYAVKKAAFRAYVEQTWGWDEAFQRAYHQQDFKPVRTTIIAVEGQDIGWMIVTAHPDAIELHDLYLVPAYQQRGIGSALITRILEDATRRGVPVRLQVLKVNPARRLYERLGFRVVQETATHYVMSTPALGTRP